METVELRPSGRADGDGVPGDPVPGGGLQEHRQQLGDRTRQLAVALLAQLVPGAGAQFARQRRTASQGRPRGGVARHGPGNGVDAALAKTRGFGVEGRPERIVMSVRVVQQRYLGWAGVEHLAGSEALEHRRQVVRNLLGLVRCLLQHRAQGVERMLDVRFQRPGEHRVEMRFQRAHQGRADRLATAPQFLSHRLQHRTHHRAPLVADAGHDADDVDAQAHPVEESLDVGLGLLRQQVDQVDRRRPDGDDVAQHGDRAGDRHHALQRDDATAEVSQPSVHHLRDAAEVLGLDVLEWGDRGLGLVRLLLDLLRGQVSHCVAVVS